MIQSKALDLLEGLGGFEVAAQSPGPQSSSQETEEWERE